MELDAFPNVCLSDITGHKLELPVSPLWLTVNRYTQL